MQVKITLECKGIAEFSTIVESAEPSNLPDVLGLFLAQYRQAKPISPLLSDKVTIRFDGRPRSRSLR